MNVRQTPSKIAFIISGQNNFISLRKICTQLNEFAMENDIFDAIVQYAATLRIIDVWSLVPMFKNRCKWGIWVYLFHNRKALFIGPAMKSSVLKKMGLQNMEINSQRFIIPTSKHYKVLDCTDKWYNKSKANYSFVNTLKLQAMKKTIQF